MDIQSLDFTLETKSLRLRKFVLDDAKDVTTLCNNINLYKNTLYLPYPYEKKHAIDWINGHQEAFEKKIRYELAVTLKESNVLVGAISISHNQRFQHGELGYWIGEPYWNKGIASEASLALINFAFNHLQYHRIYAHHFACNPASGKVMMKCGMNFEGILKEHVKKDEHFHDLWCYGIVLKD